MTHYVASVHELIDQMIAANTESLPQVAEVVANSIAGDGVLQ